MFTEEIIYTTVTLSYSLHRQDFYYVYSNLQYPICVNAHMY